MPHNVEIKARLSTEFDWADAHKIADSLSEGIIHLHINQEDTFFHVSQGRLKLRIETAANDVIKKEALPMQPGTLIAYDREDKLGPKISKYVKTEVPDSAGLLEALSRSCGVKGSVAKERKVYLVNWRNKFHGITTRVHLDSVKGLGNFIEFEVIVNNESEFEDADKVADYLIKRFKLNTEDFIKGAYLDLLEEIKPLRQ